LQSPHFLIGPGIARVSEKSIRKGGAAELAAVAGAGWPAGMDRLPAKSTRTGGPAEFAVTAGVGWTGGIDRPPAKSIRSGAPAAPLVDRCCAVASASNTRGTAARSTVAASGRDPIPRVFLSMVVSRFFLLKFNRLPREMLRWCRAGEWLKIDLVARAYSLGGSDIRLILLIGKFHVDTEAACGS
jgi:hypothetical protein